MNWGAILRVLAGGAIGAGLATIAEAAAPVARSMGPSELMIFGFPVPVMSALFGVIGVMLARRVAPASAAGTALGRGGNAALTALLALGILALVIGGEKRPLVALGWSVGLGYSGIGFVELVARTVVNGAKLLMDGFVSAAAKGAASWTAFRGDDK